MNPQEKWVARRRKLGDTDQSEDTNFEPEETNNINFLVYKDETMVLIIRYQRSMMC